jgi:O-antigen/teichoic acid export membrane protein
MKSIATLRQSKFLRYNAVFFFGSIAVGALNYAYYPILGRLMPPAAFGEIQVLVSLFLQFTIFLNVLSLITVNIAANYNDTEKAHRMIFELEKLSSYVAVGILVISIVGGEFLRGLLKFDSMLPFVALALAMTASIPLTFRSAYARGQKKFGIASISQLLSAGTKIVFSAMLVVFGLGVSGAIFGIVAAQLIAFFYAARWAARLGFKRPSDTHYGTLPDLRLVLPELKYAAIAFVGLLTITLMMSIDVIAAKYFFDAKTAGLYAGIATVARIVFFLAAPIAQVLMPLVKIDKSPLENRALLLKSLALTIVVCGGFVACCMAFPELIVRLLMGVDYITYAHILPPLAAAICLISITNLICMYYLSLRQKMVMVVGIIGFAATLSFMVMWHGTPQMLVYSMLWASILTLIATGTHVLVNLKRGRRYANENDINRYTDI